MNIFLIGFGAFGFAVAIHLIWWRIYLPQYQTRFLALVFSSVYAMLFVPFLFSSVLGFMNSSMNEAWLFPRLVEWIHISLLYGVMVISYLVTYSAIEADSPTLSILRIIDRSENEGVGIDALYEFLESSPFLRSRKSRLIHDGLVKETNGKVEATLKGKILVTLIQFYRISAKRSSE